MTDTASPRDDTLSGPEVAALLRRVALVSAATTPEPWLRGKLLERVWEDSRGWAEEDAVLHLLDSWVRAHSQPTFLNATSELRAAIARSWIARGKPARARLLVERLDDPSERYARVELTFALDGPAAARRLVDGVDGYLPDDEIDPLFALAEARWGEVASAARRVEALDVSLRCDPAVALAERLAREGRAGVGAMLDTAETSLVLRVEALSYVGHCGVDLVRAAQRIGDAVRVRRIVANAPTWTTGEVCHLVSASLDDVDPTLLDVPLATAGASEAASGVAPWDGCPGVMAELAARRADRRLAQRFLVRHFAEHGARGEEEEDDDINRSRGWSAGVRLGRIDPFAPHALAGRVIELLYLAHLFDGRADLRVERERFARATVAP